MSKTNPFDQHGLEIVQSTEDQIQADCPLCGKEGHFYANRENYQWDCKSCNESGNLYTFLRHVLETAQLQSKVSRAAYTKLSQNRGIPVAALKQNLILPHPWQPGCWLAPHYNGEGKLANLYIYTPATTKRKATMRATEGCAHHLYRTVTPFTPSASPVSQPAPGSQIFLAEGHWDAIIARMVLDEEWIVWGLPGSAFKKEWAALFEGCHVYVATDNDDAGRKQLERITKQLDGSAESLHSLDWSGQMPNDLRDVYLGFLYHPGTVPDPPYQPSHQHLSPEEASAELKRFLEHRKTPVQTSQQPSKPQATQTRSLVTPVPTQELGAVYKEFRKYFSISPRLKSAIAMSYAVHVSLLIPGRLIWLYLVGGASTSKTTTVALLEDHLEYVESMDTLTGLYSGYNPDPGKKKQQKDVSPIQMMNGKTATWKDWTAMLSLSPAKQEEIMGQFRGVFDGYASARYLNEISHKYENIRFNILAGCTPKVHISNRAEVGERFLKYGISMGETRKSRRMKQKAAASKFRAGLSGTKKPSNEVLPMSLRQVSKGYCEYLFESWDPDRAVEISEDIEEKCIDLASLVASARVHVERARGDLLYRPEVEGTERLIDQFMKLLTAYSFVTGQTAEETYPVIRDLALDTAWGFPLEILQTLHKTDDPLTKDQLATTLKLPDTTTWKHLQDMLEVGTVVRLKTPNSSGRGGAPAHYFSLSEEMQALLDRVSA